MITLPAPFGRSVTTVASTAILRSCRMTQILPQEEWSLLDSLRVNAKRRILLLTTIPSPYRFPSLRALASRAEIDLTVGFLMRADPRWPWKERGGALGFRHLFLAERGGQVRGTVRTILRMRSGVVIVGGWDQPAYLVVLALKWPLRYKVVLWSESTPRDRRPRDWLRETVKRAVVLWVDAILVPGSAAADYARSLGGARIVTAPNACDMDLFTPPTGEGEVGRESMGGANGQRPMALFVGRLASEKGIDVLLRAWAEVERRLGADLVLIGSGPLEEALRSLQVQLRLQSVQWIPFIEPGELPAWYRRADVLVLPSRSEPWGFVINEAMACGTPVIATDSCGAAHDLVVDGTTGWRVPAANPGLLADRLTAVLSDPASRSVMGLAATKAVGELTPERWAEEVAALIGALA